MGKMKTCTLHWHCSVTFDETRIDGGECPLCRLETIERDMKLDGQLIVEKVPETENWIVSQEKGFEL